MSRIRWFPVAPHTHEATHGPYLARMCHEERGWSRLVLFKNGVWERRIWSAPWKLRRDFREIVERYELERDRDRLDWLERNPCIVATYCDGSVALTRTLGVLPFQGKTFRDAVDKIMLFELHRVSRLDKKALDTARGET